jgi:hypothetical protein
MDERGDVDAGEGRRVMPEREPRVDFEQPQAAAGVALEVDLRDTAEAEPGEHVAAELGHVGEVHDLHGGAEAVARRKRAILRPVKAATVVPLSSTYAW